MPLLFKGSRDDGSGEDNKGKKGKYPSHAGGNHGNQLVGGIPMRISRKSAPPIKLKIGGTAEPDPKKRYKKKSQAKGRERVHLIQSGLSE
jgi:hypothetical protein